MAFSQEDKIVIKCLLKNNITAPKPLLEISGQGFDIRKLKRNM